MKVSHRIKEVRESHRDGDKKLSGIKVAKMLNISSQYYYEIERGEKNLSVDLASDLADLFNVTVDYLIGRENENEDTVSQPRKYELTDKNITTEINISLDGKLLTQKEIKFAIENLRLLRKFRD
ncbi:helix-turn-helix transcriptional regulator [Shouchella clausii]|uniref:helix-turn-helix domain-containing protein n=1 Tax=Shouchella clausii TaxID=79880 RepID=UPI002DBC5BC8|nr:helix-turn-helix transcriptional regulator [Shouchella clausii]MEB5480728.1 helix-turn-helix transcriptional regulator [Shouchella clausii]